MRAASSAPGGTRAHRRRAPGARERDALHAKLPPGGSSCHSNTLPALVRTPSLMMQSALDMKPFMPFPVDASSPVGLFPNFNTMDPVQKAVINHTFGVSIPLKKKQVISCNICQLRFNSDSQAEAHYKGSKHAKKLKAQESTKNKQKSAATQDSAKAITSSSSSSSASTSTAVTASSSDQPDKVMESSCTQNSPVSTRVFVPTTTLTATVTAPATQHKLSKAAREPTNTSPPSDPPAPRIATKTAPTSTSTPAPAPAPTATAEPSPESEEEKAKKLLYCSLCKVAVNSLSQLEAHNTGSKHKTMLEARSGAGPIKAYPRPGSKLKVQATVLKGSGLQNKTFHCEICDVHVNSEIQLKQHISSRRHKDRVAGKPMKPKYSPYNKQQRSSSALAAKLALQKDLVKPISPAFISSHFSPTTVPSISLHPRPNTSIFQTATLPPSFLRAAPGPIRPSTGSILFAPY
ncbi:zinc finger protein 385B isoform X2 [Denticeps clupeoides]|uniref:Zinc finger protein 385B n=1 Tax=Denticeps clupeoides TaxID=299321 RepID=A0AAY4EWR9_9TELE|nr:zinc finger protein 385B isoform X2 [Denticeps clupeoides]